MLVDRRMGNRRFEALRQENCDTFARRNALAHEPLREGRGLSGKFAIGQRPMRAIGIEVLETDALRLTRRPGVADGNANVEPLRDLPLEGAVEFVVSLDSR
ncbi:hypothetical protein D9M72_357060 [compost metagenome]